MQRLLKAEVESLKKDLQLRDREKAELARRLKEEEGKVTEEQTLRATANSLREIAEGNLAWLQQYGIAQVCMLYTSF